MACRPGTPPLVPEGKGVRGTAAPSSGLAGVGSPSTRNGSVVSTGLRVKGAHRRYSPNAERSPGTIPSPPTKPKEGQIVFYNNDQCAASPESENCLGPRHTAARPVAPCFGASGLCVGTE